MAMFEKIGSVLLHLGGHRTGTTSMQSILDSNRGDLRSAGVGVVTPSRPGDRDPRHVIRGEFNRYVHYAERIPYGDGAIAAVVRRRLVRAYGLKGCRSAIVSDENLLGRIVVGPDSPGIYPHAAKRLKHLNRFLGGGVSEVFLALRSYDEFLFSAFQMLCAYGKLDLDGKWMSTSVEALLAGGGWPVLIERIRESFPGVPLRVWIHEKSPVVDRVHEIARASGCLAHFVQPSTVLNRSPSREAIASIQRRRSRGEVMAQSVIDAEIQNAFGGKCWKIDDFLSEEVIESLKDRYEQDKADVGGAASEVSADGFRFSVK